VSAVACVELRATLPAGVLPQLEGMLWLLSPNGILVEDALCLHGEDVAEGLVRVALYVAPQEAAAATAGLQREAAALGVAIEVLAQEVAEQDWNRVWKQHYQPLMVGDRVRVEPAWLQSPEQAGQLRIVIDPGMAFGTGTHETTQLCMLALVRWADRMRAGGVSLQDWTMLDAGTGSAILAILAVRLGVGWAVGTEIDAAALATAHTNLGLNDCATRITLMHTGDPAKAGPATYPLVVANILASVLVPLRDAIVARVASGGTLLLSGILAREAAEVARHYAEAGLHVLHTDTAGAWAALTLHRPPLEP
jgi:ribosomal protein L11 methyltransferase